MNFYGKKIFLLLLCSSITGLLATTVPGAQKKLSEKEEYLLKNEITQDIYTLVEDLFKHRPSCQKDEIMKYVYSDTGFNPCPSFLGNNDQQNINEIKKKIQDLSYFFPSQAEEIKGWTSRCLKSLPKRGIGYGWTTILHCFTLARD